MTQPDEPATLLGGGTPPTPDLPESPGGLLTALFSQLEAGHRAATNEPTRDELDTEFRAWFADAAGSPRPGLSINETVHARMDY